MSITDLIEALVRDIPRQIAQGWSEGDGRVIAAVYAADGVSLPVTAS